MPLVLKHLWVIQKDGTPHAITACVNPASITWSPLQAAFELQKSVLEKDTQIHTNIHSRTASSHPQAAAKAQDNGERTWPKN